MNTFTIIHAGNDSAETITAQGEMLKVAIENLEKIKMRGICKDCGKMKPLMSRLDKCNGCFLEAHKINQPKPQPPQLPKLKAIVQPPPPKAA